MSTEVKDIDCVNEHGKEVPRRMDESDLPEGEIRDVVGIGEDLESHVLTFCEGGDGVETASLVEDEYRGIPPTEIEDTAECGEEQRPVRVFRR